MLRKIILVLVLGLLTIGASTAAAQVQSTVVWQSSYYNNTSLQGNPVFTEPVGATFLNYNWQGGSPSNSVQADNFSGRWVMSATFAAGTYRFFARADDSVRVIVDGVTVIDTFAFPNVGNLVTGDIALSNATHTVVVEYREFGGVAYMDVEWQNLGAVAPNPTPFPTFPPPSSGPWIAQYYSNPTLSGAPTVIQSESSPTHFWGTGAPAVNMPVDNWSARWTATLYFTGNYQLSVRADDGVRVTVDGVTYINEFHSATGQTYTANLSLGNGPHTFVVEYLELGIDAFLVFNLDPITVIPTQQPSPAFATVLAGRLNVRRAPDPLRGLVLTKISQGETYPIIGRNADSSWWKINVNGTEGWVSGRWVQTFNTQGIPVIVDTPVPQPPVTPVVGCPGAPETRLRVGGTARVTGGITLNLRNGPSLSANRISRMPPNTVVSVLSGPLCANGMSWYEVNYVGTVGWAAEGASSGYWLLPAT